MSSPAATGQLGAVDQGTKAATATAIPPQTNTQECSRRLDRATSAADIASIPAPTMVTSTECWADQPNQSVATDQAATAASAPPIWRGRRAIPCTAAASAVSAADSATRAIASQPSPI